MPFAWEPPEPFITYRGVTIYHTYDDDFDECRLDFWYSTSSEGLADSEYEFDIRDLPGFRGSSFEPEYDEHKRVIIAAIDAGLLRPEQAVEREHDG